MNERRSINYIYFGILFILLAFVHVYHLFLIEGNSLFHRGFYIFCAVGQCLLEVGGLVVIYHFLGRYFKRVFVVATFLLFLAQVVDFPLTRLFGMSIWYIIGFLRDETPTNFIELIYASTVPVTSWILGALGLLAVPVMGILFFQWGEKWSQRKPLSFCTTTVGLSLFSVVLVFTFVDGVTYQVAAPVADGQYLKALPWKTTFFSSSNPTLRVGHLKASPSEKELLSQLESMALKPVRKPNIFLFIGESLREDYLTSAIAPTLAKFKADNIAFRHALSAANGTQQSWLSIFHSVYPFYWDQHHPEAWKSGSLPVQMLKKAGYQVHVYSASRLCYYRMDERLFGENHQLADTFQVFEQAITHENDSACMAAMMQELDRSKEGNLFVVFLDSTHFGYSWPEEDKSAVPEIDYFHIAYSNAQLENIKTRYRHAIHFMDGLWGRFLEKLQQNSSGKESVVVFTGDHGEEFFEEGHIFHISNLNTMQTHVPLYFKLGSKKPKNVSTELASHLDIFPTVLHHVFGKEVCEEWFDGESLLKPRRRNFVISTRYNASRAPYEFLIHDGKKQLVARFENRSDILSSEALEIVAYRDEQDQPLGRGVEQIQLDFQEPLETLFK